MLRGMLTAAADAPLAPELQVSQWFGEPTTLAALRGRVVVLHTFQMLCPGCVLHGIPQAGRIHSSFDPDDVAVIGLHTVFEHHEAMGPTSLAAFLHEFRVAFPVAVDAAGERIPKTMAAYQLRGTPSLVLIDREGRIRASWFGRPEDLVVGAAIAALVGEAGIGATASEPASEVAAGCTDEGCALPSD